MWGRERGGGKGERASERAKCVYVCAHVSTWTGREGGKELEDPRFFELIPSKIKILQTPPDLTPTRGGLLQQLGQGCPGPYAVVKEN